MFGQLMRRQKLEKLVMLGKFNGKKIDRDKDLSGLTKWNEKKNILINLKYEEKVEEHDCQGYPTWYKITIPLLLCSWVH